MSQNSKHTPLPWDYDGERYVREEATDVCIALIEAETNHSVAAYSEKLPRKANAEFITRACNSHYELTEALTQLRNAKRNGYNSKQDRIYEEPLLRDDQIKVIDELLARAIGQEVA